MAESGSRVEYHRDLGFRRNRWFPSLVGAGRHHVFHPAVGTGCEAEGQFRRCVVCGSHGDALLEPLYVAGCRIRTVCSLDAGAADDGHLAV